MNILSLNIIRGRRKIKRKRISFLIQSGNTDLCFLQEVKLSAFDNVLAVEFRGNEEVEWTFKEAIGASGGMVSL